MQADVEARGLRKFLLSGRGSADRIASRLSLRYGDQAGLGIAVYIGGKQLAYAVSLHTRDVGRLAELLRSIRAQLPSNAGRAYVLLSQLGSPRMVSIAEYRTRGVGWGLESIAARHRGEWIVMLAHVPCFMGWSSELLEEALARRCGGRPLRKLRVFPTLTQWLTDCRPRPTCRGGLRARPGVLGGQARLRREIRLVSEYLHGRLSDREGITYGYDAWRDRVVNRDCVGRKAIALAALSKGARLLGDDSIARDAHWALTHLARHRPPVGDIHDAHLLLASNSIEDRLRLGQIRQCLRRSGAIVGPDATDQEYFPGVVITALAACNALSDSECVRSLRYYRARFRREPTWPAMWWQLRAWGTVGQRFRAIPYDFIHELADWALARQLPSGAFDTWTWPIAPSFLTICVMEALLTAAHALRQYGDQPTARRYLDAVRRAMRFSRSLVLDERHANLLPQPARALGGVRDWHGGLILRSDAAGHYLSALTDLASFASDPQRGEPRRALIRS